MNDIDRATDRTMKLGERLAEAMQKSGVDITAVAEQTKVQRTTISALLGNPGNAILPGRVYLRGHLRLIARVVELDEVEALALFDEAYPVETDLDVSADLPGLRPRALALSAGLVGVGIVAIILAFVT